MNFGHGLAALTDNVGIAYKVTDYYVPSASEPLFGMIPTSAFDGRFLPRRPFTVGLTDWPAVLTLTRRRSGHERLLLIAGAY